MTTEQCLYNIAAALELIAEELKTMNDSKYDNNFQYCCKIKHQNTVARFIKWTDRCVEAKNYGNECVGVFSVPAALVLILTGKVEVWDYDDLMFIKQPEKWENIE